MPDALDIGQRVLAALERGRAMRHAAVADARAPLVRAVREELDRDILAGKPTRGRAGRISRRLHVSERRARRILDSLSRLSDSVRSNGSPLSNTDPQ